MTVSSIAERIKSQIEFLRKERELVIETANAFEKGSLPYRQLMLKAHHYSEIEQNMYVLCAMAPQMLK
jgi:hypothetical protein